MNYTAAQYDDFVAFIRDIMGINDTVLPDGEPVIGYSLSIAVELVNPAIAVASSLMYSVALNNLAGDNLLNYAQDQDGQTYFADVRKALNITGFVGGVISGSNDETTGQSLLNPEFMKGLTMGNLQNLKTSYGRQYMAIAQSYGPTLWGLS